MGIIITNGLNNYNIIYINSDRGLGGRDHPLVSLKVDQDILTPSGVTRNSGNR